MRSIHNTNHQILEKNNHYLGIYSNIKRILTLINLLVDIFLYGILLIVFIKLENIKYLRFLIYSNTIQSEKIHNLYQILSGGLCFVSEGN